MSESDGGGSNIGRDILGIFTAFFGALLKDLLVILLVFAIATAIAAGACWFYGVPLWVSLIGGFISLGVVVALKSTSIFDL